jgi:hypothetical protein
LEELERARGRPGRGRAADSGAAGEGARAGESRPLTEGEGARAEPLGRAGVFRGERASLVYSELFVLLGGTRAAAGEARAVFVDRGWASERVVERYVGIIL